MLTTKLTDFVSVRRRQSDAECLTRAKEVTTGKCSQLIVGLSSHKCNACQIISYLQIEQRCWMVCGAWTPFSPPRYKITWMPYTADSCISMKKKLCRAC